MRQQGFESWGKCLFQPYGSDVAASLTCDSLSGAHFLIYVISGTQQMGFHKCLAKAERNDTMSECPASIIPAVAYLVLSYTTQGRGA